MAIAPPPVPKPLDPDFKEGKVTRAQGIGVPQGYVAPYRTDGRGAYGPNEAADAGQFPMSEGGRSGIGARYFEDDLDTIAGMSPESLTQLQYRLKEAGLLKSFRKGEWTKDEDNAMASVFQFANRQGLLWEDALGMFAEMASEVKDSAKGSGGAGRVFTARLSNPDDLKKVFTQALYDAQGGRFMDDGQMQQMVDAYQQREYGAQRAMFDNAASVEEAPTAQTFAADEAKKADPGGVAAAKLADYGQIFERMIGGA